MREKFQQFMYGRYGTDGLNRTMLITALVLVLIHAFTGWSVIYYLTFLLLAYTLYRSFSRNTVKRSQEYAAYEKFVAGFKGVFTRSGNRAKQIKTHKFYKCPFCSQELRVPRGRGRISIKCPKCQNTFIKKT